MFIFKDTKKRANNFAPYTSVDGTSYPRVPEWLLEEIPDPVGPADDLTFYIYRELDDAPYAEWIRKSDDEIVKLQNERIDQHIASMEQSAMLPRVTREFMLAAFAAQAAAAGVDPMTNLGYARMKQLDDQIAELRRSRK